ncbi:serine-rich coiled-coil domain-containing protein 2-like isoform X3 [Acanthochromis polyacanthus]|uniref:serine-rich coiled-coil domain-containing protein 2-like isoform X3 n=1 Tax=Acanthochromis polyacanthus TaxID=80966 RepID=UPI0022348852|nr:serine-rich coiled-coil domain-containing protein 2-like isoform X3 [Acanthochromis polyacanthus]
MSAPPLVDPPTVTMPTMVSRLPKFGFRPRSQTAPAAAITASSAASSRLTNGFYHHPGPAGVNGSVTAPPSTVQQNGFIRVPTSFSTKWRKEDGAMEDAEAKSVHQHARKPATPPAGKGRGFGQPVTSSSPSPQLSPRTLPVSKTGSRLSSPASGPPKRTPNGVSKPRGALRQPQSFGRPGSRPSSGPGSRSGSPFQKKAPASRSYSSDSLGSAPSVQLTQNDRFRSRSLIQVRRQPSPTLTPSSPTVTHGNRASSAQAPPRKPAEGGARGSEGVKGRSCVPSPAALKKPLLPSLCPASKPSGISYKLSRPSLMKQSRPLQPMRVTPTNERGGEINRGLNGRRDSVETPSTTDNSPVEDSPDAPEPEGLKPELVSQGEVSIIGETLEDMSLSSTSSLDRNDTSQEYMDDFDNLGNGGVGILLLSSKNDEDDSGLDQSCSRFNDDKPPAVNGVTKATGLCFLDDGLDWTDVRLSGEPGENRLNQLTRRRRSSHPEYHEQGGSSLDLSPSDSCGSGGTYMWDEEGLEPLGGAATTASIHTNSNTTHHIGSFDSDINSIDILNNLDSDLADDDLMLDVDFPEEASLHSDGDVVPHMAQWRMRQLCWGTQDVHNDNESEFQSFKLTEDPGNKRKDSTRDGDLILDLCPTRTSCLSPGSPSLGLDVEELAEDCSAVRSQLEYLQRLLLQEEDLDDDTLTTDTLSPETVDSSHSSDSQVQALLQEVQQLREELRSRDRTIAQLTMQLTVPTVTTRCRCLETTGRTDQHTQTSVTERENVASQTPWRDHTSQILHSSNQDDQEPLTTPLPPTQAPPPARHAPADRLPTLPPPGAENDGKAQEKGDRRGRSLLPPQPSKLRLFSSSPAPLRATRPPRDPETSGSSGVKLRTSGSSRLPKPKSH